MLYYTCVLVYYALNFTTRFNLSATVVHAPMTYLLFPYIGQCVYIGVLLIVYTLMQCPCTRLSRARSVYIQTSKIAVNPPHPSPSSDSLPALPYNDGVAFQVAHIHGLPLYFDVRMLPHHEPANVAEEEAPS